MKKKYIPKKSMIERTSDQDGQSIEEEIRQMVANNTPIDAKAPMIWTEEKDGVLPQYDMRTDRQELALDAIEKVQKSQIAKVEGKPEVTKENVETTVVAE